MSESAEHTGGSDNRGTPVALTCHLDARIVFDDGDTLLLYYRTDLFDKYGKEFSDKLGYELKPPTNWKQFDEIARFFTQKLSPDTYGASFLHGTTWNQFMFIPHFKANGGKFFEYVQIPNQPFAVFANKVAVSDGTPVEKERVSAQGLHVQKSAYQ